MCFVQWLSPWIQRAVSQSALRNTVRPTPLKSALPGDWIKMSLIKNFLPFLNVFPCSIFNRNLTFLLCRFVSLEKKACQGSCQHTSCSSCLLLKPPSCSQTCASSDSACLHRFGKCVHNHLSAPQSPVCNQNLQVRRTFEKHFFTILYCLKYFIH